MAEFRIGFEAISTKSVEELSSAFYDSFDGVLAERAGRITVTVYEEASSPLEAARVAVPALERIGLSIVSVDKDYVDGPEIASRLDVTRQAVQNWAKGTRGSSFPHPVGQVGGKRIWTWNQIVEWANREKEATEVPGLSLDEAACIDAFLAERRMAVSGKSYMLAWSLTPGTMKQGAGAGGDSDYRKKHFWGAR